MGRTCKLHAGRKWNPPAVRRQRQLLPATFNKTSCWKLIFKNGADLLVERRCVMLAVCFSVSNDDELWIPLDSDTGTVSSWFITAPNWSLAGSSCLSSSTWCLQASRNVYHWSLPELSEDLVLERQGVATVHVSDGWQIIIQASWERNGDSLTLYIKLIFIKPVWSEWNCRGRFILILKRFREELTFVWEDWWHGFKH